jgi:hypothetical protein
MSFLQRPKRHDQKDMRFFKDIATLLAAHPAAARHFDLNISSEYDPL